MDGSRLKTRWIWTSLIVSGVLAGDWVVHVPESPIVALHGSTVMVSCTYDFPKESALGTPHKVLSEMWCRNQSFCITPTYVYHSQGIFPDPAYQGRVQYLGTTGSKNCSFRITDLRTTDSGVYVFRFITDHPVKKLPGQRGLILQVTDPPVNTSVTVSSPGEIMEGTSLSLTCSSHAATPVTNFTWFKSSGGRTLLKGTERKLFLESMSAEDSGLYTCTAQNKWGSQSVSVQITVHQGGSGISITGIMFTVALLLIAIVFIAVCIRRNKHSGSLQTSNAEGIL